MTDVSRVNNSQPASQQQQQPAPINNWNDFARSLRSGNDSIAVFQRARTNSTFMNNLSPEQRKTFEGMMEAYRSTGLLIRQMLSNA